MENLAGVSEPQVTHLEQGVIQNLYFQVFILSFDGEKLNFSHCNSNILIENGIYESSHLK